MMSAHVEVSDVSSEPASVSQKFITQVLREQLNFKGLIITDDLEMGGLSQKLGASVEDLALKAIVAGTDMVMVVWSWEIQEKIFDRIKRAVLEKQIPESLIDQRVSHILAIKEKWLNYNPEHSTGPKWKKNLRTPQAQQLVTDIRLEAMKWVTSNEDEVM
jgi:beta-N-acetylhexosaminidase